MMDTRMDSRSPSPPSLSPTPHPAHLLPQQPQSKRDKRRTALSDRLTGLTNSFHNPTNPRLRDNQYRAQLQSIQGDIILVQRADVSGRDLHLMDDSAESIQTKVDAMFANDPLRDTIAEQGMAGRWYSKFVENVNDAMEARDADLTLLWQTHTIKARSLALQHTRSLVHAREEHRSLASTIQQRVSSRLKAQLKKIAAEKESSSSSANALSSLSLGGHGGFDIADTNALMLHPSQFSLTTGVGSPRRHGARDFDEDLEKDTSTRRKPRRRAGEVEELMAFGAGMNFDTINGKRKRRGGGPDGASIAPEDVPTPPPADSGSPTLDADPPIETVAERKKRHEEILKQVYTPAYSLEKLFSEKELQNHSNTATLATVRYFERGGDIDGDAQDSNRGDSRDPATGGNTPVPPGDDDDEDAAVGRALSPLSELTRGIPPLPGVTTRSNPPRQYNRELESLATAGLTSVGMTYINKANVAPAPPGLRPEDAESDLALFRRAGETSKRPAAGDGGGGGKKQRRT